MKLHIIKKQTIENYIAANPESRSGFETWLNIAGFSDWNKPSDIVQTFNTADILGKGSERVVFNIGGNKYRMICKYQFGRKRVHLFVCWIGTHAEYDKLCKKGLQYTVDAC